MDFATRKPDFFVVDDDMYGSSVRVEASCALVKSPLLDELLMLLTSRLARVPSLDNAWTDVFHDRVLLEGSFFCGL